jgi:hypothetical protein
MRNPFKIRQLLLVRRVLTSDDKADLREFVTTRYAGPLRAALENRILDHMEDLVVASRGRNELQARIDEVKDILLFLDGLRNPS